MKYLVLVSHGQFADGLKDALSMLAGERDDVLSAGLKNGKSADEFAEEFSHVIEGIHQDDEIILLGDLIGGSPLTTAMNVIAEKGLSEHCATIGGMNLPLALTTVLMKDTMARDDLVVQVLNEAQSALKEFKVVNDDEDDI
ncbi:PTS sugar transporter subunit IIA [Clostridium sp. AUH-JLR23]|uniref:PTS sugar transporter subunit IIA n=1 Tax=Clostridium sp. AUH-JLR23 TaxID=1505062 RepID=UPI00356942B1